MVNVQHRSEAATWPAEFVCEQNPVIFPFRSTRRPLMWALACSPLRRVKSQTVLTNLLMLFQEMVTCCSFCVFSKSPKRKPDFCQQVPELVVRTALRMKERVIWAACKSEGNKLFPLCECPSVSCEVPRGDGNVSCQMVVTGDWWKRSVLREKVEGATCLL